jgi:hypothetical protein
MPADAQLDFTFALPATPAASQAVGLYYRISDATLEAGYNCWRAYVRRNAGNTAWDFLLESVSAGVATNRINVTGIGTVTGIRVTCQGTKHNCYTQASGVWTVRGSEVNVSFNDTATGANTIYSSAATPTQLRVSAF